jgi:hypothetical protein
MDQIMHEINNMSDEQFENYPVQHVVDNLGVRIPVRLFGYVRDEHGAVYSVYLENDRTPMIIPIGPDPQQMGLQFDEARLSDRSRARRNARISRRANRRVERPLSPVHQQPPNPASSRQRRRVSRMAREQRRQSNVRPDYVVVGGKTRRRHRRRH